MQTTMESQPDSQHITTIPEDGAPFAIQVATLTANEKDIVSEPLPFKEVTDSIESIARAVLKTLERVKPSKAVVEFGIEIAASEGKLITVVVKGDAKANLKITLEWGEELPTVIDENAGGQSS
jgi:hypothetical protein